MDLATTPPAPVASAVIWVLFPWIALCADTIARALPYSACPGSPRLAFPRPTWRERAPFLAVASTTLAVAWERFGPHRAFLGAAGGGLTLLIIAAIDWRHHLIFERVLLIGAVGALAGEALDRQASI